MLSDSAAVRVSKREIGHRRELRREKPPPMSPAGCFRYSHSATCDPRYAGSPERLAQQRSDLFGVVSPIKSGLLLFCLLLFCNGFSWHTR